MNRNPTPAGFAMMMILVLGTATLAATSSFATSLAGQWRCGQQEPN